MCTPHPFVNILKMQVVMKLCRCYSGFVVVVVVVVVGVVVVVVAPHNEPCFFCFCTISALNIHMEPKRVWKTIAFFKQEVFMFQASR